MRFLAPGYGCVLCSYWFRHYSTTVLPSGAQFGHKAATVYGGLGNQRAYDHPWGVFTASSGRPSTNGASAPSGSLHDFKTMSTPFSRDDSDIRCSVLVVCR